MRFPDSKADGEVAEWLKAHAWNACIRETVSRVRIPLSPPFDPLSSPLQACLVLTALTRHQQFPSVGEMASAFVRQKSDAIRAVPDEVGIRPTTTSLLNSPRLKARRKRA